MHTTLYMLEKQNSTFHNQEKDLKWVFDTIIGKHTEHRSAVVFYDETNVPKQVFLFHDPDPMMDALESPDEVWTVDPTTHMLVKVTEAVHQ